MGKQTILTGENKDADQLHGNRLKHLVRAAPVTERSLSLDYLTAVPGVGSSPALLAGVPCGFSRGSFVFAHLLIGLSHMR